MAAALLRAVYTQQLQAGAIDAQAWQAVCATLLQGLEDASGQSMQRLDARNKDFELLRAMRKNIWEFGAAKVLKLVEELEAGLRDEAGAIRSFQEFSAFASVRANRYLADWLEAEYNMAVAATQMAQKWTDIQARKAALPYLRYVTAGDERVRHSHALLDGVTLPVDDPFWDAHYPPNGWNCRCTVQQVAGQPRNPAAMPADTPAYFANNPGRTRKAFSAQHPYFRAASAAGADVEAWAAQEVATLAVYDLLYSPRGRGIVEAHPVAHPKDAARHLDTAKLLADDGARVQLQPYINAPGDHLTARIDTRGASFRYPNAASHSAIQQRLREAARQGAHIVVLHFDSGYKKALRRALRAAVQHGYLRTIKQVWIVAENGQVRKLTAAAIRKGEA